VSALIFIDEMDDTINFNHSAIYRNPVYHQVVFASLMLTTTIRTVYLIRVAGPAKHIPTSVTSTIVKIYWSGLGIFLTGFLVWNLDNIFCELLTTWKSSIGWPIAFLLEGGPCFCGSLDLIDFMQLKVIRGGIVSQ
jgi:hypothetical protein